ncbi:MAG TPA: sensor histidine kinase [Gemmatimonadaceae bacterium]|nr:sensor histidine kinase [Gemmatimonadaceae bacterium]
MPRWVAALLGVPLAGKLAGANALIVMAAVGAAIAVQGVGPQDSSVILILSSALGGSLLVNLALVLVALRPLQGLERTAERVWRGDLAARVPPSLLADRNMSRLGGALNVVLDSLTADRARLRRLASEIISAGDRERAYIARELHDSTAQELVALIFQLSAAARDSADPELTARLETIKASAAGVLEEVRMLAHTVHPRILDDLGLAAALERLAREARDRGIAEVSVAAGGDTTRIPAPAASMLYRVAQEAVTNALRHGDPRTITIALAVGDRTASLQVSDDGHGFEVADAERRRPGMGLFTMRERVALVDGHFSVVSQPGHGTRIAVTVPVDGEVVS